MNHSIDCKSKRRFGSLYMAIAFAFLSVFTFSCDDEKESQEVMTPSDLRYASVSEVYEGKSMETARPVVFSTGKSTFEIVAGIAEDGGAYIEGEFQIVDTTGVIRLKADNKLLTGSYFLDIKVTNSAGETVFPKAFELLVLPSAIEGLQYAPHKQTIVRGLEGQKTSVPVFKGSKPATFQLVDGGDFLINAETGEISLALDTKYLVGEYKLSVEVLNTVGTTKFEEVITIQVESAPSNLLYDPQAYLNVQQTQAKKSVKPTVKGTGPFTFALKDNFGSFTMDANTGVISLPVDHTLAIDTYDLTVVVTNAHGSVEFANAASFQIVEIKGEAPFELQYATTEYSVNEAFAFESVQPTISGSTPITYTLVDDKDAFVIDANTGVITLAEGNSLSVGIYPLTVKATNFKGEATFTDVITVTIKTAITDLVFEDGWDNVEFAAGEKGLGNMTEVSLIGDPVQATSGGGKHKWTYGWGIWNIKDGDKDPQKGAIMVPKKTENDDWLITNVSVDLTNHVQTELNFSGYSTYGAYSSTLKLWVSEDYNGDVKEANWVEVSFERLPIVSPTAFHHRKVDMTQFDGKIVTIAFQHESRITPEFPLLELKTAHFIANFEVSAVRK